MRLLLLALALPLAASAQAPTAADSALVQRFSEAARFDLSAQAGLDMAKQAGPAAALVEQMFGDLSPESFVDSLHAAFYQNLRTEALETAVALFERPDVAPLLVDERAMSQTGGEAMIELVGVMMNPENYDLADSTLAADYVDALGISERMTSFMGEMMISMGRVIPQMFEEAEAEGKTIEQMADSLIANEFTPMMDSTYQIAFQYTLREADPQAVRDLTAFYASEDGQYVNGTIWLGTLTFVRPMMNRMMAYLGDIMREVDAPTEPCKKGTPGCVPPPPPPPCPEGADPCPEWEPLHDRD